MSRLALLLLTLLLALTVSEVSAKAFSQPTFQTHERFVYGDWQASRPSVVVFVDPHCSYCLRDLPRLKEIKDYNVFFFWSPILGDRSKQKVTEIFKCGDPISDQIFTLVEQRQDIECSGDIDTAFKALNDEMVEQYDVDAVPAFYLLGRRVSLSYLMQPRSQISVINGVRVDWSRYRALQAADFGLASSFALVLPINEQLIYGEIIEKYRPGLVLPLASLQDGWHAEHCRASVKEFCSEEFVAAHKRQLQELVLLLGVEKTLKAPRIIFFNNEITDLLQTN